MIEQMISQNESGQTGGLLPGQPGMHGTDDYAQGMGLDDEQQPEYADVDPIDTANIQGIDTPEERQELAMLLMDLIREAVNDREGAGFEQKLSEYADIYEMAPPMRSGPWVGSCMLTTPDTPNAINTVSARLVVSAFGEPPWYHVTALDPMVDGEAAERQQEFVQSFFSSPVMHWLTRWFNNITTERVDGTRISYTNWVHRRKKVKSRVRITPQLVNRMTGKMPDTETSEFVTLNRKKYRLGDVVRLEEEKTVEYRFDWQPINVHQFFMQPATARDIESANVVGHVYRETPWEMQQKVRDGVYDADTVDYIVNDLGGGGSATDSSTGGDDYDEDTTRSGISRSGEKRSDRFGSRKIAAGCARVHDADGDGQYDDIFFIIDVDTERFLRLTLNPFDNGRRPYKELALQRRIRDEFYGYSGVGQLADTQYELNALTRQGIDAGTVSMTALVELTNGRRHLEDQVFRPGINYHFSDQDGEIKKVHQFQVVDSSNLPNRSEVRQMMLTTAASNEAMQGSPSANSTLGETNLSFLSANVRHRPMLHELMDHLTWIGEQFLAYCQQFCEEDGIEYQIKDDTGKSFTKRITLDDLAAPTTITAYCAAIDPDRALEAQKAEKMFALLGQSPLCQSDPGRLWEATAYFAGKLDPQIIPLLPKFIGTKEEVVQAAMQQAAQQQALQAAGLGGVSPMPGQPGQTPGLPGGAPIAPNPPVVAEPKPPTIRR